MSAPDQNSLSFVGVPKGPKAATKWSTVASRKPDVSEADWKKDYSLKEWHKLSETKRHAIEAARGQAMSRINVNQEFPTKQWNGMPRWMQEYVKAQRRKQRSSKRASQGAAPSIEASKPEAPSFEDLNHLEDPDARSEVLTAAVPGTLDRQSIQGTQEGDSETIPGTDLSDALKELSMGGDSSQQAQQFEDGDHPVLSASEMGGPSAPQGKQEVPQRGCNVTTSDYYEGDSVGGRVKPRTVFGTAIEGHAKNRREAGAANMDEITHVGFSFKDSCGNEKTVELDVAPDLSGFSGSEFTTFGSSDK